MPDLVKCTTLDCLRKISADIIINAQEELVQTAPFTIPGVPLGERQSSCSLYQASTDKSSNKTHIRSPIHPFRPYCPAVSITKPPLVPASSTPNPNNLNSKRSRSNRSVPLPFPCSVIQFHPPVHPLFPGGRGEGSCVDGFWQISSRYWGRYVSRDF
jgi:hypothetical protein